MVTIAPPQKFVPTTAHVLAVLATGTRRAMTPTYIAMGAARAAGVDLGHPGAANRCAAPARRICGVVDMATLTRVLRDLVATGQVLEARNNTLDSATRVTGVAATTIAYRLPTTGSPR